MKLITTLRNYANERNDNGNIFKNPKIWLDPSRILTFSAYWVTKYSGEKNDGISKVMVTVSLLT
jgi:hypothetical protein